MLIRHNLQRTEPLHGKVYYHNSQIHTRMWYVLIRINNAVIWSKKMMLNTILKCWAVY